MYDIWYMIYAGVCMYTHIHTSLLLSTPSTMKCWMAAVQLDLAVCSGLHLESSYTWRLFGKFTCSALGFHLECTWTSLGTTSKAFKGLQKPSKASKSLQSPHLEGLRRPSKALKGLRRPPQACKGLTSKAFKGLENPSKASLGKPLKAFEASRMHLQSSRGVPRASRRLGVQEFRRSKSSQNARVSTVFSLPESR